MKSFHSVIQIFFFRKFIKGFASIAEPLTQLLGTSRKKGKLKKKVDQHKTWEWSGKQQESFDRLKQTLLSPPVLVNPDFSQPFIVRTDASIHGLVSG